MFVESLLCSEEEEEETWDEATNWLCEDDLENYWNNNCMLLHPSITTCMDELAILKHTGDGPNLELALREWRRGDKDFFYNFDFLAQLFVGRCIKIDGERYCPHEPVKVADLDPEELN